MGVDIGETGPDLPAVEVAVARLDISVGPPDASDAAVRDGNVSLLSKKNLRHCFRPNFHIRGFDNLDQLVAELSGAAAEV